MATKGTERRKHPRHSGGNAYLRIDGLPGQLIDWSFGGIGVAVEGPESFAVGSTVAVEILCRETGAWETLVGTVRRTETSGSVGIAFENASAADTTLLVRLMGLRLSEAHLG